MGGVPRHVPVLRDRVLALLAPALDGPGAVAVDGTLGLGGHAEALLAAHPGLRLVGIDRDPEALRLAGARLAPFGERASLHRAVYDEIPAVLADAGVDRVDGVLFDLGVSSLQLDEPRRGFAYAQDAPLDMRMSSAGATAADVVNGYSVDELTRVLREYGEERFARRIAGSIVRARAVEPITSSARLVELVRDAIPAAGPAYRRQPGQAHLPGAADRGEPANWPRSRRRCRPPSTRSGSAGGSSCSATTRWRTGSSNGRSPTGPGTRRRPELPVPLPVRGADAAGADPRGGGADRGGDRRQPARGVRAVAGRRADPGGGVNPYGSLPGDVSGGLSGGLSGGPSGGRLPAVRCRRLFLRRQPDRRAAPRASAPTASAPKPRSTRPRNFPARAGCCRVAIRPVSGRQRLPGRRAAPAGCMRPPARRSWLRDLVQGPETHGEQVRGSSPRPRPRDTR